MCHITNQRRRIGNSIMFFSDWWIWNKVSKEHGDSGYDVIRGLILDKNWSDGKIIKQYPSLSTETVSIMRLIFHIESLEESISMMVRETGNENRHRGLFRVVDSSGEYITYKEGDIVSYDNKTYLANQDIEVGMGPLHESSGWKEITPDIVDGGNFT